jgi:hypothetical protein
MLICFSDACYFYLSNLMRWFRGAFKWSYSAHWITFYERIFLYYPFYLEDSPGYPVSTFEAKLTVFFCEPSFLSFLGFGNREFKNLRTFGHLIDSTRLTSPPFTSSLYLFSFLNIEFYKSSAAEGRISSSTVRHMRMNLLTLSEYFEEI